MKKKKNKLVWIIIILLIAFGAILYRYFNSNTSATNSTTQTTSTIKEVTVGTQTITKTLTSSGEISSNLTEDLSLNTYRYFSEIYVSENDFVSEGENILKYTNGKYLTAPYDLVVTKISVPEDAGDACTSAHYIGVQSTETLTLSLKIDESEISSVAVGQEVEIVPSAYEDQKYTGTITKINQIGTYASNGSSFTATVVFANDEKLKIGMSASCTITLEKVENVIAVPIEAIQTKNDEKYVIVENTDGTTTNVTVETGLSNDAYVEIKSGLSGGETIQMIEETTSSNSTSSRRGQNGSGWSERNERNGSIPTRRRNAFNARRKSKIKLKI